MSQYFHGAHYNYSHLTRSFLTALCPGWLFLIWLHSTSLPPVYRIQYTFIIKKIKSSAFCFSWKTLYILSFKQCWHFNIQYSSGVETANLWKILLFQNSNKLSDLFIQYNIYNWSVVIQSLVTRMIEQFFGKFYLLRHSIKFT